MISGLPPCHPLRSRKAVELLGVHDIVPLWSKTCRRGCPVNISCEAMQTMTWKPIHILHSSNQGASPDHPITKEPVGNSHVWRIRLTVSPTHEGSLACQKTAEQPHHHFDVRITASKLVPTPNPGTFWHSHGCLVGSRLPGGAGFQFVSSPPEMWSVGESEPPASGRRVITNTMAADSGIKLPYLSVIGMRERYLRRGSVRQLYGINARYRDSLH